ncbi:nucleotidyltransferase domain-containing protein [Candidatus Woesearchaeota archaeon]|nr:nucleotidyltransferase domain-containing protein [Candidatus Woesearchaeota archaeon]
MVSRQDLAKLREFKKRISRTMPVEKMYLFGSRAIGNPKKFSDFDVMIISPAFKGKESRYRCLGLYKEWTLKEPFDFVGYTPEEYRMFRKKVSLVAVAEREGIEI